MDLMVSESYAPENSEDRATYLRDFLNDIGSGVTGLYTFFHPRGFSNVAYENVVHFRIKFLGTLSEIEVCEQEFEALTGMPHCSFGIIRKRLNELIKTASFQKDYKDAQRVCFN